MTFANEKQLQEELKRLEFYRKHEKKFLPQISITKQIITEIRKALRKKKTPRDEGPVDHLSFLILSSMALDSLRI
tara:strand:+ start:1008 stop:1232 length:225 start_codon:yes stop_codon:yes gene_type:complete